MQNDISDLCYNVTEEQLLSTITTKPIRTISPNRYDVPPFWFCNKLYPAPVIFNLVMYKIAGCTPSLEVKKSMQLSIKWDELITMFDENEAFLKEWKADPSVFFKYYFGDDYEAKLGKIVWEDDGSELLLS